MTKHMNTAQEIVEGWESGQPVAAICGFERVLVEGKPPEGDICSECAQAAEREGFVVPTKVLNANQIRSRAKGYWSITQVSRWTYEVDAS